MDNRSKETTNYVKSLSLANTLVLIFSLQLISAHCYRLVYLFNTEGREKPMVDNLLQITWLGLVLVFFF